MSNAAAGALAVSKVLDGLAREDGGGFSRPDRKAQELLARGGKRFRRRCISAMAHWSRNGIPDKPQNWLLQVAHRKAIDQLRQKSSQSRIGVRIGCPRDR